MIKECVRRQLSSATGDDMSSAAVQGTVWGKKGQTSIVTSLTRTESSAESTNGSCSELESLLPCDNYQEDDAFEWQPLNTGEKKTKPKFEAYMMTGEHILKVSHTPQSTTLIPKHQKKIDSLRYHTNHTHNHKHHHHNSVPTSPNEMDIGYRLHNTKSGTNSAGTSPVSANKRDSGQNSGELNKPSSFSYHTNTSYVRTSRSEDHLQFQKDSSISAVDIEIEEDITSSLNTLLDTRLDSGSTNNVSQTPTSDRIVWTYNAPVSSPSATEGNSICHVMSNGSSSSQSTTTSSSSSPLRSTSPASPTSVSSSVMSSHSSSHRVPLVSSSTLGEHGPNHQPNGDLSVSEAISNMSSPDYHDEETLDILNSQNMMEISDHSDSDSTILVSEPQQKRINNGSNSMMSCNTPTTDSEHRIVIQVKGPDKDNIAYSPKGNRRGPRGQEGDRIHDLGSGNMTPELQGYQVRIVFIYDSLQHSIR